MTLYAVAMIGVVISWFAMRYLGRRLIDLGGLGVMIVVLLTIGFDSLAKSRSASFATGSLLLVYVLFYDITIGSVAYSIVAEIPSSRLRTKTIVLARSLYNIQGIVNGVITPYMLNPDAWNWKGKAEFFWAGMASLCFMWTYFRLPEPKGRTYAEMDVLFEQGIDARRFNSAVVDPFQIDNMDRGRAVASR